MCIASYPSRRTTSTIRVATRIVGYGWDEGGVSLKRDVSLSQSVVDFIDTLKYPPAMPAGIYFTVNLPFFNETQQFNFLFLCFVGLLFFRLSCLRFYLSRVRNLY